jgi:hypothetical protein
MLRWEVYCHVSRGRLVDAICGLLLEQKKQAHMTGVMCTFFI